MREVRVVLRFTTPCLGDVKSQVPGSPWPVYLMPRMPDGRVRFEAVWWKGGLRFAAQLLGRFHSLVNQVIFDVAVEGEPVLEQRQFHKRYLTKERFVKHQHFDVGSQVAVTCVAPHELTDHDLLLLLEKLGQFRGITPYGYKSYGRFVVESVTTVVPPHENQTDQSDERGSYSSQRQSATHSADIAESSDDTR